MIMIIIYIYANENDYQWKWKIKIVKNLTKIQENEGTKNVPLLKNVEISTFIAVYRLLNF